jgi:hypothetical protein
VCEILVHRKTMFLHLAPVVGVMILCFYFLEDVPVDMALDLRSNPRS